MADGTAGKERWRNLTRPGVQIGLFVFSFTLVSWPLLRITEGHTPGWSLVYAFSLWALMVVALGVVALALRAVHGKRKGPRSGP